MKFIKSGQLTLKNLIAIIFFGGMAYSKVYCVFGIFKKIRAVEYHFLKNYKMLISIIQFCKLLNFKILSLESLY